MTDQDQDQTGKQRLRPWLEDLLNKRSIDGLYWLNTEKKTFRIPWYHHGRPNWTEEKGRVFKVRNVIIVYFYARFVINLRIICRAVQDFIILGINST
jgi:hypothetical protein